MVGTAIHHPVGVTDPVGGSREPTLPDGRPWPWRGAGREGTLSMVGDGTATVGVEQLMSERWRAARGGHGRAASSLRANGGRSSCSRGCGKFRN